MALIIADCGLRDEECNLAVQGLVDMASETVPYRIAVVLPVGCSVRADRDGDGAR